MADSLTEWAKLEKDEVMKGVYETIITHDAVAPLWRFRSFEGNAFVYNRELTLPTASTHAIGATMQSTRPTFTKKTATLTTVYTQSDVDLYIKETRGSVQDTESVNTMLTTKALTRELSRQFIQGDAGTSGGAQGEEIEGLNSLLKDNTRWLAMDSLTSAPATSPGSAETTLTQAAIDQLIDEIDDARSQPDCLLLNTKMRRKIMALSRASTSGIQLTSADMFGHKYVMYGGVPLVISNFITNAETYEDAGTWPSSTATSIIAIKFGEDKQGHVFLHNGPVMKPRMIKLAIPVDEHQEYTRMYVYSQGLVFAPKQIIGLGGIDSAT